MNRQSLFPGVFGVAMALALSGCAGLTPVYGDRAGGAADTVRFNFSSPDSRLEQIVLDRLKVAFPAKATPNDPVLDIAVNSSMQVGAMSDAFAIGRPTNVRVEASVTISQRGAALFEATRFADAGYQGGKIVSANIESIAAVEATAARSAADAIRVSILAGYQP